MWERRILLASGTKVCPLSKMLEHVTEKNKVTFKYKSVSTVHCPPCWSTKERIQLDSGTKVCPLPNMLKHAGEENKVSLKYKSVSTVHHVGARRRGYN
jgi:uncharacterized OsmC-like protein